MLTKELVWHYPDKISDAIKLIKKPGYILHAGGTRILKTKQGNLKGVVDIGALDLNYILLKKYNVSIGAAATFTDVVNYSRATGLIEPLAEVLADSASTPLRNRITIGGSLKDFPLWSSCYAPLIAMNAKVEIAGPSKRICSLEDYFRKGYIKTKHLLRQIIIPTDQDLLCVARKFTLLRFEYPMFVIAVSFKLYEGVIKESKIIVTGVKGRIHRYTAIEKLFRNKTADKALIEKAVMNFSPKFHADFRYSKEYKEQLAKVYFHDILNEMWEELI